MRWHELGDLPFADALTPHPGPLAPDSEYDCAHFDQLTCDGPDAGGSRFLECAFTRVSVQDGRLRRAQFTEVWLQDVRLVATSLAETSWMGVTFAGGLAAGVEAFGSRLRRVVLRGCKLDSVNFRDADLADVVFDGCVLKDVDFAGAALTRTSFPGCWLRGTDFSRVRLDHMDLRGAAELSIVIEPRALHGAIVTGAQLQELAPLLAASLGITVKDS
ncbi:MAG: pentapeptide repeat-containing protein [Actinobacteria bacterium]|nr:pentapeptide repeat-containing protein [Actinomycetota bacterium]